MNLQHLKDLASQLSHDDKLRLALTLIEMTLTQSQASKPTPAVSSDYAYCLERVLKSRPARLPALENYLEAILSFKGSQSTDIKAMIDELQTHQAIRLEGDKVVYLLD